jgi:hypothetical protein
VNTTYPRLLKISQDLMNSNCSMNATQFQVFHLDEQLPAGAFFENGATYLVYAPRRTGMQAYFGEGEPARTRLSDLLAINGTIVNQFMKIVVSNGTLVQATDSNTSALLGGRWGYYEDEAPYNKTSTNSNVTIGEVSSYSNARFKTYQMFSGLPGVRMLSNYDTPCSWEFPQGYEVSTDGSFGYVKGPTPMMLYCKGASVLAYQMIRRLSCASKEGWLIACDDCQKARDWLLYDKETEARDITRIENVTGYSPHC